MPVTHGVTGSSPVRTAKQGQTVDALALGGEEGRDKLR